MVKAPSGPADDKALKEARLAVALRANLRRRKAAKVAGREASAPEKQDDPKKG